MSMLVVGYSYLVLAMPIYTPASHANVQSNLHSTNFFF